MTHSYSARGIPNDVAGSYGRVVHVSEVDADGNTRAVDYGANILHAAFAYDPTMRWLESYKLTRTPLSRGPGPRTLAEETFERDLVGNLTAIKDNRLAIEWPDGAKPNTTGIVVDDLYRAVTVTSNSPTDRFVSPIDVERRAGRTSLLPVNGASNRATKQEYRYDWMGNTVLSTDDENVFFDRSLGTTTNGVLDVATNTRRFPNQLREARSTTGSVAADYDAAGNVVSLTVNRAACSALNGKCSHVFAYQWDEVGQLAAARRWDFTTVPPGTTVASLQSTTPDAELRFTYGGSGERVLKEVRSGTNPPRYTVDIFDSFRLVSAGWQTSVADYERTASTETVYIGGLARVGKIPDAASIADLQPVGRVRTFLELGDTRGGTAIVVDRDSGELVERTTYQPFGATESDHRPERWGSFRESMRLTGKEEDQELGLLYFGARYYSPHLGRWMSPDPLAIHAGGGDINPYAYVRGRVFDAVDPLGLDDNGNYELPKETDQGTVYYTGWDEAAGKRTFEIVDDQAFRSGKTWRDASNIQERWSPTAGHENGAMLLGTGHTLNWVERDPEAARALAEVAVTGASVMVPAVGAVQALPEVQTVFDSDASTGRRVFAGAKVVLAAVPFVRPAAKAISTATRMFGTPTGGKAIALGMDLPGGGLKQLAESTGSSWWRYWARDGITRRTVTNNFGRAFNQATERASAIHFSLDGIDDVASAVKSGAAGFGRNNMTNAELFQILSKPELYQKTYFYRGGQLVPFAP